MWKKYQNVSDADLVLCFRRGEIDAETELLDRYKIKAKLLANNLYGQFKNAISCDLDDLANNALFVVIKAAKTYKKGSFEAYWKTIARNELMDMIKKHSESYCAKGSYTFVSYDLMENDNSSLMLNDDEIEAHILYDEMILFVKRKIANEDYSQDIFIDYLNGLSVKEMAVKYNIAENQVRYRLEKVKQKIANALMHS